MLVEEINTEHTVQGRTMTEKFTVWDRMPKAWNSPHTRKNLGITELMGLQIGDL